MSDVEHVLYHSGRVNVLRHAKSLVTALIDPEFEVFKPTGIHGHKLFGWLITLWDQLIAHTMLKRVFVQR